MRKLWTVALGVMMEERAMRRSWFLALVLLVIAGIGAASPAYADMAPPQNPPGSSIQSGQENTQVQMVSENVVMTIGQPASDTLPNDPVHAKIAAGGHVDATFNMQNQGSEAESFDAWFPIGIENGMGGVSTVQNFTAYVDGVQSTSIGQQTTKGQFGGDVPWATWPVSFPPGKPVTVRVTYDTVSTGWYPYGMMSYILETGAGWNGPIGEGTVTFRLPYPVTSQNVAISGGNPNFLPRGGTPAVSGTDVVWHFTNLEPTAENNISLEVLAPAVWTRIQAAESAQAANPASVDTQLELANALHEGLYYKYELVEVGSGSRELHDMAINAYEVALKLDPNKVDIYRGYIPLLESDSSVQSMPSPRYVQLLDRALQLAPDDERFQQSKAYLSQILTNMATMGTTMPPVPTVTPAAPAPQATATPASLAEAATPTAAAQPLPAPGQPTPTPASSLAENEPPLNAGLVIVLVAVAFVVFIGIAVGVGVWVGRRSRG